MSSENLILNTFDLSILDNIEKSAGELYDEIHKVNNVLSGLLNVDCTNYKNITKEYIDTIKKNFIDNIDIFVSNLKMIFFADLGEYSLDQLIDILSSNDLEIFKLKNLLSKDLNYYLTIVEKEIYEYSLNKLTETYTINKIKFYQDIYNNPIIQQFLNRINMIDTDNTIATTPTFDSKTIVLDQSIIENLINDICNEYNLEYSHLTEMKYTLWDDKIELYEIKNKKTLDFIYIYFDLFKREHKNEKNNIIYIDNILKKICLCYYFDELISEQEYNQIKNMIRNLIIVILK